MRLVLLGAPGVGKGTQAAVMAKALGILHICSGDLLRQAVSTGTALGKEAKAYMEKGELVPDELVSKLVLERLRQPDTKNGFVLDGYPRNIHQADELESALMKDSHTIDKVINLEADQEIIIQRLAGRRLCSGCQANYHIKNMPPKKEGICDHCQGKLYQRIDDNEKTIKNRLKIYKDQTLSLIDYYSEGNKLLRVTANEEAQVVLKIILEQLNDYNKIPARD